MKLPDEVRERFRRYGEEGGHARAAHMRPEERTAVARQAATVRWIRTRFGGSNFRELGIPGGDLVDTGLADLAAGETTVESLLVSLAVPRLRREGVPVGPTQPDPERQLYDLLTETAGDLAHARYGAYLRQVVSFADACRLFRVPRGRDAS